MNKFNRKGVMYLAIVMTVLSVLMVIIYTRGAIDNTSISMAPSRVKTIDSFITSFEADLAREVDIGGFRTLIGLTEYVTLTGNFVNDSNVAFQEIFLTGNYNNFELPIMRGSYFDSWLSRVDSQADKIGVSVTLLNSTGTVKHVSPWIVELMFNLTVNISDDKGFAFWILSTVSRQNFSIINLEDPVYTIGAFGFVPNMILRSNITSLEDFVNESNNNDTTILKNHLNNSLYMNNSKAPSFLMRMENNLSNSSFGIESLVNKQKFTDEGYSELVYSRSVVDYIYFGNNTPMLYCNYYDLQSWFMIDDSHRADYDLEGGSVC